MDSFYSLVTAVEQDLSRNATPIAEGIAQNLAWLADDKKSPQKGSIVVDLARMQRLGLADKEGKITPYGRGVYNKLLTEGYYGTHTQAKVATSSTSR